MSDLTSPTLQTPAAILDLAIIKANCTSMLTAAANLNLLFRPHVKTHKTHQLTQLQVGPTGPVNIVVSTIKEAEYLLSLLLSFQSAGRPTNVLFGFPVYTSLIPRLATLQKSLGPQTISLLIDDSSQFLILRSLHALSGISPLIYLKIDCSYRRAGLLVPSPEATDLIRQVLHLEQEGVVIFHGFYAHAGHSYKARNPDEALEFLVTEFKSLGPAAAQVHQYAPSHPLVLSVGATPTATALQNPSLTTTSFPPSPAATAALEEMSRLRAGNFTLEIHAGNYSTLDLQQLATHSGPEHSPRTLGISILAEICSRYPRRGPDGTDEFLVNVGCLALGREPCGNVSGDSGHYDGYGIPMSWAGVENMGLDRNFPENVKGWVVGKISQEHGILRWVGGGKPEGKQVLKVGQRVRIWPNHSCIAGAGFDHYLVVDGSVDDTKVVDQWERCNGW